MKFTLMKTDGAARRGEIETPRGTIRTPAFMPVGTAATVKAMYPDQVRDLGADIVLGNTYHLMLRPGAEEVGALGGLQEFMQWDGPILTDSGGFQVMSLSKLAKMSEEGVRFQSHLDGSKHMLTPERSIEIQTLLGANIRMVLDECTPFPATHEQAETSMQLSMRWAERSKNAFADYDAGAGDALFGIVQGGVYEDLRHQSAAMLQDIGFDGYAVGGLAVGEGHEAMLDVLDFTTPVLPQDKPRYLMGVGTPEDLVEAVARGVDMFDCVMPTRAGRHGTAYSWRGKVNIRNARHADDPRPLDESMACDASSRYSRAYLHHLHRCGEYLGAMLLTWHNLAFYQGLMAAMRAAIEEGRFEDFRAEFYARQKAGDIDPL
ncbi:tRNA guanosine(34) transglycosylase Tgt [Alphaproteobacteria bacterium]|nr:tRNA guanosine(34) transglycosylase Tgt [Alphaproteobacteria bacterium]MDB2641819.1 tRNA guanosine(34) transglycosylase Tgt [Alphaproteobacteria bacterium]